MKKITLILFLCLGMERLAAQSARLLFPAASVFSDEARWEAGCLTQCRLAGTFTAYSGLLLPFDGNKSATLLLCREQWGDFRRLRGGMAYAQSFGEIFSLAMGCGYHSLSFSDPFYGRKRGAEVSLSACFRPAESYSVWMAWENPFGLPYWVEGEQREPLPSTWRAALVYKGMASLTVAAGAEKVRWQPVTCGLWMEGQPATGWQWRLGCCFPSFCFMAGAVVAGPRYRCDFSLLFHQGWGPSLSLSLSRGWGGGKEVRHA